jgi:hypothetical protein
MSEDDSATNERAIPMRDRIMSVHKDKNGTQFLVITDAGHETTTVLLPEDY